MPFLNTKKQVLGGLLLGVFALLQTVTLQYWVGQPNLYGPRETVHAKKTLELHEAILKNQLKQGKTWADYGGGSLSHRIGTVYFAELLSKLSGKSVFSIYKWIDHIALFVVFVALYLFLDARIGSVFSLIGLLFFAANQVTTYFYHYFHPWDRISQICWILGLWLVSKDRLKLTLGVIAFGVTVKYDFLMLGVVYFFFMLLRERSIRGLFRGALATLIGILVFWAIKANLPNQDINQPLWDREWGFWATNIRWFLEAKATYPPFLVFLIPVFLVVLGFKRADDFEKACAITALAAIPVYFCTSFFNETRAEMPLLIMMLPAALKGLQRCVGGATSPTCEEGYAVADKGCASID